MNTIKFVLVSSIVLCAIGVLFDNALGQNVKDGIFEDQIIVCVNGHVVEQKGNICHLYNADDLDYYQDVSDGSFFDLKDSFDMAVVD